jgi:hypothetical protein
MYRYEDFKNDLNEDQVSETILNSDKILKSQPILSNQDIFNAMPYIPDGWTRLAVIDRMIELGCIRIIKNDCATQDRAFAGRFYIACKQDDPFHDEKGFTYYGSITIHKQEAERIAKETNMGHAY